jgi:hypothetical protein
VNAVAMKTPAVELPMKVGCRFIEHVKWVENRRKK